MKRLTFLLLIVTSIAAFSAAQTAGTEPFSQEGIASWYGDEFDGKPTASGEVYDSSLFTAAHPTLPFGTMLIVTNMQNMRQVTVRVNDRGPFVAARIIDLSRAAAEVLDMLTTGTAPVLLEQPGIPSAAAPRPAQVVEEPPAPVIVQEAPPPVQPIPPPPPPASPPVAAPPPVAPPPPQAPPVTYVPPVPAPPPAQSYVPASPAEIRGGIPPAGSSKFYRLQVGAYIVPRNASDAFDKLKSAGLNPAYERFGDYYRVVLARLRAAEIPAIAQTLGNIGFKEAIIREE